MADDSKPRRKSVIASLDLKNYKQKYIDPYGDGSAVEVGANVFVNDAAGATEIDTPKPKSSTKTESSPSRNMAGGEGGGAGQRSTPKSETPSLSKSATPSQSPSKSETSSQSRSVSGGEGGAGQRSTPKTEPSPPQPPSPSKTETSPTTSKSEPQPEKFEDIVRRIERNKKKSQSKNPSENNQRNINDQRDTDKNRDIKPRPIITPNVEENVDETPHRRSVESYGIVISAIALIYSINAADKAFFYLSLSLFTYLVRPIVGTLFGKHNHTVQNILKGFSLAVFVGAILFIFL